MRIRITYIVSVPGSVDPSSTLDGAHQAASELEGFVEANCGLSGEGGDRAKVIEDETSVEEL